MSKRKVNDVINDDVLTFNVYLNTHHDHNHHDDYDEMMTILLAVDDDTIQASYRICSRYCYTFDNHSVEFCDTFPYFTGYEALQAVNHVMIGQKSKSSTILNCMSNGKAGVVDLSKHRLMIITDDLVDITVDRYPKVRYAHICIEVGEYTLIQRNKEHNFVLVDKYET